MIRPDLQVGAPTRLFGRLSGTRCDGVGSGRNAAIFGEVMAKFKVEQGTNSIRRAPLAVAAHAHDADDCRTLLSVLGILPGPDTPAEP